MTAAVRIRRYRPGDGPRLAEIYLRAVEAIGPRDYTPPQVAAWAALCPSPARLDALAADGRVTLVAVEVDDRPLAFADLEADGHIHFLYCDPGAAGSGVASALCDELERMALARGTARLYAEASEAARRFFLKRGFVVTCRRDFEVGGVAIHNYAVEKILARRAGKSSKR